MHQTHLFLFWDGVDFYFKDYYLGLKRELFLTFEELAKATRSESSYRQNNSNVVHEHSSDSSSGKFEAKLSARNESNKLQTGSVIEENSVSMVEGEGKSGQEDSGWASKELIKFIEHVKDGDRSALSQFEVRALLYKHIKRHNLLDPCTKSDILCDSMLQNLFGKTRIEYFEMLNLLESHFLKKEPSPLKNLDDYAAIDMHNISLMYLRRNMLEDLLDNIDTFSDKVIGSFVRIRILGDVYRLVRVVGIGKAAEKYKSGEKETDVILEIFNLNEKECINVNFVSSQEFSEEECKQLRQSIKCGYIGILNLGDVQEKAEVLKAVRVNDWIEREKLRLGKLRDRASEQGCREQLRECLEKLEVLSTREELMRRLNEVPEIHADPKMDPRYGSSDDEGKTEHERQGNYGHSRESFFVEREREGTYLGKGDSIPSNNRSSAQKSVQTAWENKSTETVVCTDLCPSLNQGKKEQQKNNLAPQSAQAIEESLKDVDHQENTGTAVPTDISPSTNVSCRSSLNQGKKEQQENSLAIEESLKGGASNNNQLTINSESRIIALHRTCETEKHPEIAVSTDIGPSTFVSCRSSLNKGKKEQQENSLAIEESLKNGTPNNNQLAANPESRIIAYHRTSETERVWHYQDPSGKVQGPFSMTQLQKWNKTGVFPATLRVWKSSDRQEESILLTDALSGKFFF